LLTGSSGSVLGTPENAPFKIGLGLVALGIFALWYRRDLYRVYQWLIRYPIMAPVYVLIQLVGPAVVILGGLGLIVVRFIGGSGQVSGRRFLASVRKTVSAASFYDFGANRRLSLWNQIH